MIFPAMAQITATRAALESLTTNALVRMADNLGLDVPPDLDRIFIIEELLEFTSPEETVEFILDDFTESPGAPAVVPQSGEYQRIDSPGVFDPETAAFTPLLIEPSPLPKRYNLTFVEVMIRDPLWAFVFWEIKLQEREQFEKFPGFEGYYLKVSPLGLPSGGAEAGGIFTVQVEPGDFARYVGLSPIVGQEKPQQKSQVQYRVELCAGLNEAQTVLAVSNSFRLPELHELPAKGESRSFAEENPLVHLSGYGDIRVLRTSERLSRVKRDFKAGSYE